MFPPHTIGVRFDERKIRPGLCFGTAASVLPTNRIFGGITKTRDAIFAISTVLGGGATLCGDVRKSAMDSRIHLNKL